MYVATYVVSIYSYTILPIHDVSVSLQNESRLGKALSRLGVVADRFWGDPPPHAYLLYNTYVTHVPRMHLVLKYLDDMMHACLLPTR